MLQMRNVMITTIGEDYVLAAQAKGLSPRRIMFTYAARNAILPNIAGFALAIGFVVAGALVMEIVFSYPGVGYKLYNAVTSNDYPLMQGIFLVISPPCSPPACSPTSSTCSPIRARARGRPTDGRRCSPPTRLPTATAWPRLGAVVHAARAAARLPRKAKVGGGILGAVRPGRDHRAVRSRPTTRRPRSPARRRPLAPTAHHLLGTDRRPARTSSPSCSPGSRSTVVLGLLTGTIATALSVAIGVAAGLPRRRRRRGAVARWRTCSSSCPALPLLIVMLGYLPHSGELPTAIVLSALGWPWGARVIRAQTLTLRSRDYVAAAREIGREHAGGSSSSRSCPNEVSLIAASFVGTFLYAILTSVALAFIGVADLRSWSYGTMLYWAQNGNAVQLGAWWWYVPPGSAWRCWA